MPITMCDKIHEQRINVKFIVKIEKKNFAWCYKLLTEGYCENSLSRAGVLQWFKQFSESQQSTEDDEFSGRPVSISTSQTVTNINKIASGDRRICIRMMAETVNAHKETVRKILPNELNMRRVCEKLVRKNVGSTRCL